MLRTIVLSSVPQKPASPSAPAYGCYSPKWWLLSKMVAPQHLLSPQPSQELSNDYPSGVGHGGNPFPASAYSFLV